MQFIKKKNTEANCLLVCFWRVISCMQYFFICSCHYYLESPIKIIPCTYQYYCFVFFASHIAYFLLKASSSQSHLILTIEINVYKAVEEIKADRNSVCMTSPHHFLSFSLFNFLG